MRTDNLFGIVGIVFGLLIVLALFVSPIIAYSTVEYVEATITDKERIVSRSGDSVNSKYLVFTDSEVFENTDTILFWKFNSTDYQNFLTVGDTFVLKVNGFRIPLFSSYRNILDYEKLLLDSVDEND